MRKSKKPKFAPRGPQHQRPKSWSKRQESRDPRKQRKRLRVIYLDSDSNFFQTA